jgi:hypothetical protein
VEKSFPLNQFHPIRSPANGADRREGRVSEIDQFGVHREQPHPEPRLLGDRPQPIGLHLRGRDSVTRITLPPEPKAGHGPAQFSERPREGAVSGQALMVETFSAGESLSTFRTATLEHVGDHRSEQSPADGDHTGDRGIHDAQACRPTPTSATSSTYVRQLPKERAKARRLVGWRALG